ncbi:MAG: HipA N-terminal domain-containing protein [Candidatus Cloacimonetes bacterium]|nr:HipA N-terminal domain-containing protein [Candidatus Cloacimonadota bacterium]
MKARILCKGVFAGILAKTEKGYRFQYDPEYLANPLLPAISLTLQKKAEPYISDQLFPFFHGLLAEGYAAKMQSKKKKIDESDYFSRLINFADRDTIGCVTAEILS